MSRERISRQVLDERLPAVLREQLRRDGLPRDHLPSWDYIRTHTRYSAEGLNIKCQEFYDQTLHEHLREHGFGARSNGKWPTDNEETIQSLEYFIKKQEENRGLADSTIESIHSAIRKVYEAIHEEELDVEMLDLGSYASHKERLTNIQRTVTIIEYMDRTLSDGTMQNYPHYFSEYYRIVKNAYRVDLNPVEQALDEFEWVRSKGEAHSITEDQLKDVWNTLDNLEECPVQGYDLDRWKMWMKVLIVFLVAVGPRSSEVERLDVRTQLHFGDDPHVHFDKRKNLRQDDAPGYVPIMMGSELLQAYREYIQEVGENGRLVPSPQSESGSRTADTLNEWLRRLCKIANVRLPDGTLPTIQNFRQLWKTNYKKALHKNRNEIKFVSDEGGTDNPKVDEENYIDDVVNRRHVRELGRKYFGDLLNIDELPKVMQEELDQKEYFDRQTSISEY